MITTEQYNHIITELLDELPEEFFRELSGGVIVSEAMVIPDYAQGNDLYTMGQYKIYSGIRQIVMFRGSFNRAHPNVDLFEAKELLRGILRHEFRHHLEFLAGIHDSSSLEAEDERMKWEYLSHFRDRDTT
jgi:hypothetical protein